MTDYRFIYEQQPGVIASYRATLYSDDKIIVTKRFWWERRAIAQCQRWAKVYGAMPR